MHELAGSPATALRDEADAFLRAGAVPDGPRADALGARFRAVVAPALQRFGALRLPLVGSAQAHEVEALERLLALLSRSLGFVLPQTHRMNLLARIQDEGSDYGLPSTRGHQTNAALAFHSDRCDLNLLLYVRVAARGGELSVVSYEEAAQRLRELDPAACDALFDGFPFDLRDERIFDSLAWHWRPILWRQGASLRGHYIRRFITDSQRHEDCPRLDARQRQALDRLDAVLETLRVPGSFAPRPGELVLLDNYRVMHARTGFVDADDPRARRLALRTWVAPFDSEPLPPALHALAGACTAGSYRGGVGRGTDYRGRLGRIDFSSDTEPA